MFSEPRYGAVPPVFSQAGVFKCIVNYAITNSVFLILSGVRRQKKEWAIFRMGSSERKCFKMRKIVYLRYLAIFMVFCLVINPVAPFSPLKEAAATGQPSADELAGKAVLFIHQKYQSGEKVDGYTAWALAMAGEDLGAAKWTRNGKTLKAEIENQSDLLGDGNGLITYICSTQNSDGSFGPYVNEYGTKAPLQALAEVKGDIAAGGGVYDRVLNSIAGAVNYFRSGYQNGSMTYAVDGMKLDYRCVEALAKSGEDLSAGAWVYQGVSLKDAVKASARSAAAAIAADPGAKDAVYLAKELAALYAVDPSSDDLDTLAGAIVSKQAGNGGFGGSIYDHAMVLTALGKTNRMGGVDQTKAFNYINSLKRAHQNSWGQDAGVAWGSDWTRGFVESDTTAQVITALSYFNASGDPGSDVYRAIQDGLACLNDVQDADTAAVVRTDGDSTFSTAETLIALKALGKTFDDYAGVQSNWVKRSKTKTAALCLLALNQWNDSVRRDRLADLLAGRQRAANPGRGSFENSVYSDMWAYLALGGAGKMGGLDVAGAREYLLSKQGADGSWGESFGGVYYPDVLSTTQAIRVLTYLPGAVSDADIQAAINKGLAYLKGLQQNDGGVYAQFDDPAVDNSEVVVSLRKTGGDPEGAEWTRTVGGKKVNPVSYLMNHTMNADGSFGASKNIFGATVALTAYILQKNSPVQGGAGGGGQNPPASGTSTDQSRVYIAVVGKGGEVLYGPDSVSVRAAGRWGLTALGALHATGLNYTDDGGFIKSIAGQANVGMNGWMYKINDTVPMMPASAKAVSDGDRAIWWYSTDMNSPGPVWGALFRQTSEDRPKSPAPVTPQEQNRLLPAALRSGDTALVALEKVEQLVSLKEEKAELIKLDEQVRAVAVVGKLPPLDLNKIAAQKKELAQNEVNLTQKVAADTGAVLADAGAEVALGIPAGALSRDVDITIKKVAGGSGQGAGVQSTGPAGFRPVSAVYEFGPEGSTFAVPVTIFLKMAIPPLVRPESLVLARYDKSAGRWAAIPAVVDLDRGLILARVWHFSHYAVFAGEPVKSFADVTDGSFGWAKGPIELLAGAGVVTGVDGGLFEPARAVTRAEFATLLVRVLGLQGESPNGHPFGDVRAGEWYSGPVSAAYSAGLVRGYGDGTFRPDGTITREEAVVILAGAMKLKAPEQNPTFTDAGKIAPWAKSGVAAVEARGVISGFPDGAFRPEAVTSRAQCVVMVYRMLTSY